MEVAAFSNSLVETLQEQLTALISSEIVFDATEARNNELLERHGVLNLIKTMKAINPLFRKIFKTVKFGGSFYEGLRITNPNEFDLQIVMELPFIKESSKIELSDANSTFCTYQLNYVLVPIYCTNYPLSEVLNFFDDDGFFLADETLMWFQNLIEEAMEIEQQIASPLNMWRKQQRQDCPAFTMKMTWGFSRVIDVDLVPAFSMPFSKIPRGLHLSTRFRQHFREQVSFRWNLVPNPPKDRFDTDPQAHQLWRPAFPDIERALLKNTGCLPKIIKIFKLYRDKLENSGKPITSYTIKSFFLQEFDKNPDLSYWSEVNLGVVFLEMLESFRDAMENHFIPHYYNPRSNLLSSVSVETTRTICYDINKNLNTILIKNLRRFRYKRASEQFCTSNIARSAALRARGWRGRRQFWSMRKSARLIDYII